MPHPVRRKAVDAALAFGVVVMFAGAAGAQVVGGLDVPFAAGRRGLAGALLGGWQLNGIASLRSGHPFTVELGFNRSGNLNTTGFSRHERPDLKPGCSSNPVLGGPNRCWDVSCFQLPAANTRAISDGTP